MQLTTDQFALVKEQFKTLKARSPFYAMKSVSYTHLIVAAGARPRTWEASLRPTRRTRSSPCP